LQSDLSSLTEATLDVSEVLKRIQIPPARSYISIRPEEGSFLHDFVRKNHLNRTLEVGLAFGMSACCIMSAHEGIHTALDPYQAKNYDNLGLKNLESLGYRDRLDFHTVSSQILLPRFVEEKRTFDLAFIDGDHRYDSVFVDFFFADMLLQDKGYVLFHDAWMRGIRLTASFIKRNRTNYRRLPCPRRNMILFQKNGQDDRPWHHFREFYTWRSVLSHSLILLLHRREQQNAKADSEGPRRS